MDGFPWKCPACGTVPTHPVNGCRHCNHTVEEPDPIFNMQPDETISDLRDPGTVYQLLGPPKDGKVSVRVLKRRSLEEGCLVPFTFNRGLQEVRDERR